MKTIIRKTIYNKGVTKDFSSIKDENKKLVDEYLKYLAATNHSKITIESYYEILKGFFSWNYQNNNDEFFLLLKKKDFIFYFSYLRMTLLLSPKRIGTIKAVLSSFSTALELLYEDTYATYKNKVKYLDIGDTKKDRRDKLVLSEAYLKKMLDKLVELKKYHLACFLAVLISSGLRRREILQLKLSDFDDNHKYYKGMFYKTDKIRGKGRGVEGKIFSSFILASSIDPYLNLWLEKRKKLNIDNPYLFIKKNKDGKYEQAKIRTLDSYAKSISNIFGFPFYMHSCRHFYTTKLKSQNVPDEVITFLLHWNSVSMINVYDDTKPDEKFKKYLSKRNNSFKK